MPQIIVCSGRNLNVVIEGRPPMCFRCQQSGHVQKNGTLMTEEEVETRDMQEEENEENTDSQKRGDKEFPKKKAEKEMYGGR